MAVKHLQNVQRQQLALAMATDSSVLRKFKSGFNECTSEIEKYVNQLSGIDDGLRERMKGHLQKCIGGIEQVAHFNFPGFSNMPFVASSNSFTQGLNNNLENREGGDQNNNARMQISQSIQLIPSRLPTGEIALLLPNNSNLSFLPNISQQRDRPSAFATVIPSSERSISPITSPNRGFRPVKLHTTNHILEGQPQVPQVSSTSIQPTLEVKPIRFPIQDKKNISPKKLIEPLCIITNQSERYKHAQTRLDSVDFEENRQQGVKRKFEEVTQSHGLLTFVPQECGHPTTKMSRVETVTSSNMQKDVANVGASTSKDNGENSDMWRPW